jgi:hypothetical protein
MKGRFTLGIELLAYLHPSFLVHWRLRRVSENALGGSESRNKSIPKKVNNLNAFKLGNKRW